MTDSKLVECPRCKGKGAYVELDNSYGDIWEHEVTCWVCDAEGEITPERLADYKAGKL